MNSFASAPNGPATIVALANNPNGAEIMNAFANSSNGASIISDVAHLSNLSSSAAIMSAFGNAANVSSNSAIVKAVAVGETMNALLGSNSNSVASDLASDLGLKSAAAGLGSCAPMQKGVFLAIAMIFTAFIVRTQ
jgi:hypothetical protein